MVKERLSFERSTTDLLVAGEDDQAVLPDDGQPVLVGGPSGDGATWSSGPGDNAPDVLSACATPMLFSSKNQRGGWALAGTSGGQAARPVSPCSRSKSTTCSTAAVVIE